MSYVIVRDATVRDATETAGERSRKTRFYVCLPDVPGAVWSWTSRREIATVFSSREEAKSVARTKIKARTGVRIIQFRERA